MDLHFTVSPHEVDSTQPLKVDIIGSRLVVSGFASGRSVCFEGDFGNVSIKLDTEPSHELPVMEVPAEAQGEPAAEVAPETGSLSGIAAVKPEQSLFNRLSALRKQISSEKGSPAFTVFHDSTLKEMCRLLPTDLQSLKVISGVGESKQGKYGEMFLDVIRKHVALYGREGVV